MEDIVNGDSSLGDSCSSGYRLSQSSLKGSFEALMSMDIHSVENLVELAASSNSTAILSELTKSYSDATRNHGQSSANMSSRMESFIKSLSSANLFKSGLDSQQALGSLLNAHASRGSLLNAYPSTNIFDAGMSCMSNVLKIIPTENNNFCACDQLTRSLSSIHLLQRDFQSASNHQQGFPN